MPPSPSVQNSSWKDTSKLSEANWSVLAPGADVLANCQFTSVPNARWDIVTPLGVPVLPDVKRT